MIAGMSAPQNFNPATGQPLNAPERTSAEEVEATLAAADAAARDWGLSDATHRAAVLGRVADGLERDADAAAGNITREMGKPITQARGEVAKCVGLLRMYAETGPALVAPRTVNVDDGRASVHVQPLGVILGIMPWNFPYWQVIRWAVPTLTTGNACVLKHADNVPSTAAHLASLFAEALGDEAPVFASISVSNEDAASVIGDDRVRGVSLTGSGRAGRAVASQAGGLLKPTVLELGGSDAAIVLPGCDLDKHIDSLVTARFQNTGQTCVAAKRFLVHRELIDEFRERFVHAAMELPVGDPTDEATKLGPLARMDLRDALHEQVEQTVLEGGRLLIGGQTLDRPGYFYEPTVLDQITPDMTPFTEELFGPAASIVEARDDDELLAMANATPYGLAATVWTDDADRAAWFTRRLQAGCVFVNQIVKSDGRLPFGGIKNSGYGRELGGEGVRAFANLKTVWAAE